jgi:DNA-binding Lrp family transcriptional regulator
MEGVRLVQARIATAIFRDPSSWRLDALNTDEHSRMTDAAADGVDLPPRELTEVDLAILQALQIDGRRSAVDLASDVGASEPTVKRRLSRLIQSHQIVLRCQVAHALAGWPIAATCWASVPPEQLEHTARSLLTLQEVSFCAAVTGPSNLLVSIRLRTLDQLQRFEARVAAKLPWVVFDDRALTLVQAKASCAALDSTGRRVGSTPIAPWAEV